MSKDFYSKLGLGLILNVLLRLKSLFYFPIIVNLLNKEDVGLVSYAFTLSALFIGFALLNIPDASNRFFSLKEDSYGMRKDQEVFNTIISMCVLLLITFTFMYIAYLIISNSSSVFSFLLLSLILVKSIFKMAVFYYQVIQKVKFVVTAQLIVEYSALVIVCVFYFLDLNINYAHIITLVICTNLIASAYLIKSNQKYSDFKFKINLKIGKSILSSALFLMPTIYAMILMQNIDFFLVEKYLGLEKLAEYSFSYSLSGIVLGIQMALSIFWFSKISKMDNKEKTAIFKRLPKLILIFQVTIFVAYYTFTGQVIDIINSEYSESKMVTIFLAPSFLFLVASSMYSGLLYSNSKERVILRNTSCSLIINLILNMMLIQSFGTMGAAIATCISYLVLLILNFVSTIKYSRSNLLVLAYYFIGFIPVLSIFM